jgi:hypothetical protein
MKGKNIGQNLSIEKHKWDNIYSELDHWSLFWKKLLSCCTFSDSNDTGLMSVSCPGVEFIAGQRDKQTFEYCYIL